MIADDFFFHVNFKIKFDCHMQVVILYFHMLCRIDLLWTNVYFIAKSIDFEMAVRFHIIFKFSVSLSSCPLFTYMNEGDFEKRDDYNQMIISKLNSRFLGIPAIVHTS